VFFPTIKGKELRKNIGDIDFKDEPIEEKKTSGISRTPIE